MGVPRVRPLTRHPLIAKTTFTGSTRTGAAIMSSCALHGPKPVTLELGGKSPQLVFDDAPHVERLAGMVATAITGNAGQVCVAGSRLIVQRGIAEQLVDGIAARFAALRPGATWDADATLPPIISASQAARMLDIVQTRPRGRCSCALWWWLVRRRARRGVLRSHADRRGHSCQSRGARGNFGPVLTVQTFDTEEEGWHWPRTTTTGWLQACIPPT